MAKVLKNIFSSSVDEINQNYTIESWHVSQSIDAFTGVDAYDITVSGSLSIVGATNITSSLKISGSTIITGSTNINGILTVTQGITGSLFGTGSWANNATTSSYALTASHTPNSVVEFTNQSTWTFTHNLNNRYVIVQTLDSNHNQIIPQNIYQQDSNVVVITFPTNESGYAIAR